MPDCKSLAGCPFFNDKMSNMPSTSELFKSMYCHGDQAKCARYLVSVTLGKSFVPSGLFPNDLQEAKKLIAKHALKGNG